MKNLFKNVKSAFGGNSKSKRSRSVKNALADGKRSDMDCSNRTYRTMAMSNEFDNTGANAGVDSYENAFFHDELMHLQENLNIKRVTFQDFIQRCERDDLLAMHNIFLGTNVSKKQRRQWKVIQFQDTIEGEKYRRWLFKKANLRRALEQFQREAYGRKLMDPFPILFAEHIKIDMDDMPANRIDAFLQEIEADIDVNRLSFDGFLNYQDVDAVIESLVKLLMSDRRRWEKVVLRVSFDGEEFDEWNSKIEKAKRRLRKLSHAERIPIELKVC